MFYTLDDFQPARFERLSLVDRKHVFLQTFFLHFISSTLVAKAAFADIPILHPPVASQLPFPILVSRWAHGEGS